MTDLQPILEKLISQYPWLAGAIFWTGSARLVLKWFSTPLQAGLTGALVRLAGDPDGDALAHRILQNGAYRLLSFALDLTCSWKLPTHATFTEALALVPRTEPPPPV